MNDVANPEILNSGDKSAGPTAHVSAVTSTYYTDARAQRVLIFY